jgi:hypothetical protein
MLATTAAVTTADLMLVASKSLPGFVYRAIGIAP